MARDLNLLHPSIKQKAEELIAACAKKGLKIGIAETWRSQTEQDTLYAQGRTKPGSIVTNAKYPQSQHCWGTAFDFYRNDGKGAYVDTDGFFTKVGKIGQEIGLEWGGAWTSLVDKPHFQLAGNEWNWKTLQTKHVTPERFKTAWIGYQAEQKEASKPVITKDITDLVDKIAKIITINDRKGLEQSYAELRCDNPKYYNSMTGMAEKLLALDKILSTHPALSLIDRITSNISIMDVPTASAALAARDNKPDWWVIKKLLDSANK